MEPTRKNPLSKERTGNPGRGLRRVIARLTTRLLLLPIRFWQLVISPLRGPCCRYHPSCSEYARQAILEHGPLRGGLMALRRLLRCHPWGGHGHDPVPPRPTPHQPR